MTAGEPQAREAVQRLAAAQRLRRPCPPVRDLLAAGDLDTAYAVQTAGIAARLAAGATVVGHKIGLTNPKVQVQLGVDQPDFGVLLDDMSRSPHEPIESRDLLQPKIEAELAFVLAADLTTGPVTEADVEAATDYVVAALEIVDSRITDWDITIVDTVADNASSGLFVLGDTHVALTGLDPRSVEMDMTDGEGIVSSGSGADCLGDPRAAVAWLANTALRNGTPLRAGDVVLSGALGPMVPVTAGATYTATITGVGTVTAAFTGDVQPATSDAGEPQ
ncbi:fumarylacetoacetate hydrolase family protein [Kribbella sp. NBC_00382]|uniref:2-keto-4-pentenoate hydratase n=1 Tax=Kribbella sp. NBC_00382 TaxID=2975967 RepID=UPI002E247C4B